MNRTSKVPNLQLKIKCASISLQKITEQELVQAMQSIMSRPVQQLAPALNDSQQSKPLHSSNHLSNKPTATDGTRPRATRNRSRTPLHQSFTIRSITTGHSGLTLRRALREGVRLRGARRRRSARRQTRSYGIPSACNRMYPS